MAELKGSVIGELRGRLGNLSARIIDGRTILSQRPTSFHVNNSDVMIAIRQKFAVTVSFVKSLITMSALYQIWTKAKTSRMSAFNFGFRNNFPKSATEKPTVDNMLTPPGGFPLDVTVAAVAENAVTATIAPLDTVTIVSADERNFVINGLICYYNPTNPEEAPYSIVPIYTAPDLVDTVNPIDVNIPLDVVQQATGAKYQKSILYLALATLDADSKVIQYSSTFAQDV